MREVTDSNSKLALSSTELLVNPIKFNNHTVVSDKLSLKSTKDEFSSNQVNDSETSTYKTIEFVKDKCSGVVSSVVKSLHITKTDRAAFISLKNHESERTGNERKVTNTYSVRLKIKSDSSDQLPHVVEALLKRNFLV